MAFSPRFNRFSLALALGCSLALSACAPAHDPASGTEAAVDQDPLEPLNRGIYNFNYGVDTVILKPINYVYRGIVPEEGREMVSNFVDNLYTPVVFANSVFQADPQNSFASFWRFMLNSTFGVAGLFDFASEVGLHNRPADFGETLAFYGVDSGPYLVLPIIGPSNLRDATGRLADAFLNPFNYIEDPWPYVLWGVTVVDQRSRNTQLIDEIYRTSLDPYSTFRSGYTQRRAAEIQRAHKMRNKAIEQSGSH